MNSKLFCICLTILAFSASNCPTLLAQSAPGLVTQLLGCTANNARTDTAVATSPPQQIRIFGVVPISNTPQAAQRRMEARPDELRTQNRAVRIFGVVPISNTPQAAQRRMEARPDELRTQRRAVRIFGAPLASNKPTDLADREAVNDNKGDGSPYRSWPAMFRPAN